MARLRARLLFPGTWTQEYAGLYKVLHESTLNRRMQLIFKEALSVRATAAVQACMDAGPAPADRVDRFLRKLVMSQDIGDGSASGHR
ncbi:hypothetical protein JOF29_006803 [Kribbella aluminosa]|uniref:Uncharacterized protein n=1 Tax=Kribbella aluminosa TaxID=416017 RepID=A0ABS4UVM4_9ACTN|nr:hypothetical protein [Kribbella aluminosa]MBP2355693.1 hypothetical protein [Kribbella aluminosa]